MTVHAALVYIMVVMAAADREMTDKELLTIGDIVRMLPGKRDPLAGFDSARPPMRSPVILPPPMAG